MHKAIVHIGTEKTGSTAIQNFLYKNEKLLSKYGYYFPWRTCGLISNFRLAIYTCNHADSNLLGMERNAFSEYPNADYTVNPDGYRAAFTDVHVKHIQHIHNKHSSSTVVYSSEHFHSRITHDEEVQRLYDFLDQFYDQVEIIVYFRRQDRLAVSGHNTSIQGGATNRFSYPEKPINANYFDYLSLVTRWSNVFGTNNMRVRIFEKDRLVGGDVGKDFKAQALSAEVQKRLEKKEVQYELSNPRLSHSALETLLEFNKMTANDPILKGKSKAELRQPLISALHELKDDFGEVLPTRSSALAYYEHFRKDNQTLFDTWSDGQSFTENFSMFPEEHRDIPEVDARRLLEQYLPIG